MFQIGPEAFMNSMNFTLSGGGGGCRVKEGERGGGEGSSVQRRTARRSPERELKAVAT